jgi:Flp pilus assembly protein TadD
MVNRKFSLRATTVSLIALSTLTGCVSTGSLFGRHDASSPQASYEETLRVAASAREAGDLPASAEMYNRAASFATSDVGPLIQLADVYWQMKNPSKSAEALEKARGIDANNTLVLRNLGRAYVAQGEAKKAQDVYLAALAIDSSDARILNGLGIAYDLDGDHATAQSHFRAGVTLAPNDLDLRNNLAYSLISTHDYDKAIALLEPVYLAGQGGARLRQNLALAYGLNGRDTEARAVAAEDLSPVEVDRNMAIYRQLRDGGAPREDLLTMGRPSFTRGGLDNKPAAPAAEPPAPQAQPVVTEPVVMPPVVAEPVVAEPVPVSGPTEVTLSPASATPVIESKPEVVAEAPREAPPVKAPPEEKPPVADKPVDLVASAPTAATQVEAMPTAAPTATPSLATDLPAPASTIGLGGSKVYLGQYDNESAAREAWIAVWTNNSTVLGSLVASIEPSNGKTALFAVGSGSAQQASDICTQLRSSGVSCGVSN